MNTFLRYVLTSLFCLSCCSLTLTASAASLSGKHEIVLSNAAGERQVLGHVIFSDGGNGKMAFRIAMSEKMEDYFLAMRPFLCLTGSAQRLCWFPVHNEEALISEDDLLPLEYALMFMRTKPKGLHLNPFDGLYYKMHWQGNRIVGELHEVDMAPFIAPDIMPPDQRKRPLQDKDFFDADPGSNWLPQLSIE